MTCGSGRGGRPIACAPTPAPAGKLSKPSKLRMSQLLKQLPDTHNASEEGCADCLRLMEELRAEGFINRVGSNVHNHAMRLCAGRLDIVERLFAEVAEMNQVNEAAYAMLVQAQVEHGEVQRARAVLDKMLVDARVVKPRLRSCAPLLRRLCEMDETTASVELWERLARRGVEFTAPEYGVRLRMHGRTGDTRALHHCLGALLERQPTPDAESIEAISAAVRDLAALVAGSGSSSSGGGGSGNSDGVSVSVATETPPGVRLLGLDAAERGRVRETLLERAADRSASGYEHLREYVEWLRVRPPFDYVLDGPNIAYFNQNWAEGAFSFQQIQDVIDAIRDDAPDARVLVLLPAKYLKAEIPNHTSSRFKRTKLTAADWALIDGWRAADVLYECASDLYDDWYWMYASVAETQAAEPSSSVVPPSGVTRVVTNDAMRDHWDQLLPTIAFNRWRHAQILPFGCHNSTFSEMMDAREAEEGADASVAVVPGAPAEAGGGAAGVASTPEAAVTSESPVASVAASGASEVSAAEDMEHCPSAAEEMGHAGRLRMQSVGLDGPLRTWVAPAPCLSVEAQRNGQRWHVPVPETSPQEWLCIHLPLADGE